MKDIDFDELDRAVNSLMASATPDEPATPANDTASSERVLEIGSSEPPAPTSAPASVPVTVAQPELPEPPVTGEPTPRPQLSVPASRGRFMDMVQKTPADQKPRPVAVSAPSREGLTITPRPSDAPSTPEPEAVATLTDSVPPEVSETMPDPIAVTAITPVSPVAPAEAEPTPPTATPISQATEPTESPFLADAKVEKRPLNAGSKPPLDLSQELSDSLSAEPVESDDTEGDEPPLLPQVPELNSDLLAIESSEKVDSTLTTQAVETSQAAKEVDPPAPPLGAASIAQQYRSQPSSGDQSHAAIYDASQYPEPVTHPAKKKSGWLWILWVLLLLGVGAGGAVVLYKLGII